VTSLAAVTAQTRPTLPPINKMTTTTPPMSTSSTSMYYDVASSLLFEFQQNELIN